MNFLDEKLIVLSADVKNAQECITLGGKLLKENGFVNDGYVQAVLEREKHFPTGLQGKEMAIAIPHTENTFVNKPAVGVIIPKKPIRFLAMGSTDTYLDCEIVFPLVVKDSRMQVKMLKHMMHIIQDSALLKKIKASKSTCEVFNYLAALNENEEEEE